LHDLIPSRQDDFMMFALVKKTSQDCFTLLSVMDLCISSSYFQGSYKTLLCSLNLLINPISLRVTDPPMPTVFIGSMEVSVSRFGRKLSTVPTPGWRQIHGLSASSMLPPASFHKTITLPHPSNSVLL
jgi:hypothetical protein